MLDFAFSAVSLVAVAAWLMLALACAVRIGAARRLVLFVAGRGAPIFLSAVYLFVLVRYWGSTPGGGFQSLTGVQLLFAAPGKMLRWRGNKPNAIHLSALPPIQLAHFAGVHAPFHQNVPDAQRREKIAGLVGQLDDSLAVKMVVVVVGKNHCL